MNNQGKREVETKDITVTALMAALVFVGTFYLKLPSPTGYVHLGDCMILLTVCLFGWRKGAIAGSVGAGLADLIGGWLVWVVPTILFKAMWACVMGFVMYKLMQGKKFGWLVGAIAGVPLHILGYTLVRAFVYGGKTAIVEIPALTMQTLSGVILCALIYGVLVKANVLKRIQAQYR